MEAAEAVRIEVQADAACATAETFFERVRSRAPAARAARADEPASVYRVVIEVAGDRVTGRVVADDGEPRELSGTSCSEVVDALAITVALSIERRSPPEREAPRRPVVPLATAQMPLTGDPSPVTSAEARWRGGVGAEIALSSMGSLHAVPVLGVFAELGPETTRVLSPWLRVSGATFGGSVASGEGRIALRWWVGHLDGCPLQAIVAQRVVLRPCAGVEAGALSAVGSGVARADASQTGWAAARGLGTVTWAASDRLFVEASFGVALPITRPRFLFLPADEVFRPPLVAPFGGIGGGLTFP